MIGQTLYINFYNNFLEIFLPFYQFENLTPELLKFNYYKEKKYLIIFARCIEHEGIQKILPGAIDSGTAVGPRQGPGQDYTGLIGEN